MCRTEYPPINTSAAVASRPMNLIWSENSMVRLSMVSVELDECRSDEPAHEPCPLTPGRELPARIFFFKQKTAYEIGLGIPAEPLFRSERQCFLRVHAR